MPRMLSPHNTAPLLLAFVFLTVAGQCACAPACSGANSAKADATFDRTAHDKPKKDGRSEMKLIAHRGESYLAPENTLAAIDLAWRLGDEMVEIDIHLTKDNRLMLSHDATTTRTAGADLTIGKADSAELRRLDVGKWKGESFAGEKMPLLDDVLASLPPGKRLFIEIKSGPETTPHLKKAIHQYAKRSQVTVIGFDLETVSRFKEIAPSIPVYWLLWSSDRYDPKLIDIALERRLDGLNVNSSRLDKPFADAVKAKGLKLYVWTVDDPNEARRLMGLGIDGLTTNRAAWMREQLAN